MNTKSKSFIEDTLILLLIVGILYGLYSFFFGSKDVVDNSLEKQTIVEKSITVKKEKLPTINEKQEIEEKPKSQEIKKVNEEKEVLQKRKEESIKEEEKSIIKTSKEPIISTQNTVGSFYKAIEQKIYSNISQNIKREDLNRFKPVDIRLTILKNGRYEQLTFIKGDRNHFNSIKSSIRKVFPLNINSDIKGNFPRYFRMKVQY